MTDDNWALYSLYHRSLVCFQYGSCIHFIIFIYKILETMMVPIARPGHSGQTLESRPCVWEIMSLVPGRVKLMTYKIDTCLFLVGCSALLGMGKDWLAQCQESVTEWDIGSS